jgi:hypothetical protein
MAQTYRLQVAVSMDSLADKDMVMLNPVFHVGGVIVSPDSLCDDLAAAMVTKVPAGSQIRVRAYKLPKQVPNIHVAEKFRNKGTVSTTNANRDVAVCLSFYAGQNVPTRRGRLYIPAGWLGDGKGGNLRPSGPDMANILAFRTIFENLGATNVDWSVWSERLQARNGVTNVWVDDEWDTQRRRGLRPTARVQATTSETGISLVALAPPAPSLEELASSLPAPAASSSAEIE